MFADTHVTSKLFSFCFTIDSSERTVPTETNFHNGHIFLVFITAFMVSAVFFQRKFFVLNLLVSGHLRLAAKNNFTVH